MPADFAAKLDARFLGKTVDGRYRITRRLGQGGMGAVYEAQHQRLGKRLALKVLSEEIVSDDEAVRRFYREARIASDAGHPHIIDVQDFNYEDGIPYLVLEYLEGEDLEGLLQRVDRLDPLRAAFIAYQICSALEAVHLLGVIHRDLKPGNIFLCQRQAFTDYVKVLDFGISKVLGSTSVVTLENSLIGTPYYMAPEQAKGEVAKIGPATDVFALGVILYHMLSGKMPFRADRLAAVLYQVIHQEPTPLDQLVPDVSPALARVVNAAMRKDSAERTPSASRLAQGLLEALPELEERVRHLTLTAPRPAEGVATADTLALPGEVLPEPAPSVPSQGDISSPSIPRTIPSGVHEVSSNARASEAGTGQQMAVGPVSDTTSAGAPSPRRLLPWIATSAFVAIAATSIVAYVAVRKKTPAPEARSAANVARPRLAMDSGSGAARPPVRMDARSAASKKPATPKQLLARLAKAFRDDNFPTVAKLAKQLRDHDDANNIQKAQAALFSAARHMQLNRKQKAAAALALALTHDPRAKLPPGLPDTVHEAFAAVRCRTLRVGCPKVHGKKPKKGGMFKVDPKYPGEK